MTAHFWIDAVRPVAPSRQSRGTVVKNFFRPSQSVTDGGSFDSVRLTPHSAHDDSSFLDRRMAISLRGLSIYAIRPVATFRQSMGDEVAKFLWPFEAVTGLGSVKSVQLTAPSAH